LRIRLINLSKSFKMDTFSLAILKEQFPETEEVGGDMVRFALRKSFLRYGRNYIKHHVCVLFL